MARKIEIERCRPIDEATIPQSDIDLDEYEDDTQEETDEHSALKDYQEDVIQNGIKRELEKGMLTPKEEEALKEKFIQEKTDEIKKFIQGKTDEIMKRLGGWVANEFNTFSAPKSEYEKSECAVFEEPNVANNSFDHICYDLMDLHRRKNKDYGNAADASYREFGLVSYVIRLNDKLNRLKSLTKPGTTIGVKDESIEDTLMDLAAYAIMAIESLNTWR